MEKEDKDLLLKDLCARLPYGVKCEVIARDIDGEMLFMRNGSHALELTVDNVKGLVTNDMYEIKPYLFPLSSMTGVEILEYLSLKESIVASDDITYSFETYESIDWLNKNHFDYRGLIPMGLANDATGKNIY